MSPGFFRYELRTKDVDAARAFYEAVFGSAFWGPELSVGVMPAPALARGAPPHWVGHLGPADVEAVIGAGATRLGPVLRDPFGAIVAVSTGNGVPSQVGWHVHHSADRELARSWYADQFAWGPSNVSFFDGFPGVHPQWLLFFQVEDIEAAAARVRAQGGLTLEATRAPNGATFIPCDDPQGGAFGLFEGPQ